MKQLTLYIRPSCAFSMAATSFLVLRGADFQVVNLDQHEREESELRELLKGRKLETPTYEVDGQLMVAPDLSTVAGWLEEWGLPEEAVVHKELRELKKDLAS